MEAGKIRIESAEYVLAHFMAETTAGRVSLVIQENEEGDLACTFKIDGEPQENPPVLDRQQAWALGDLLKQWAAGLAPPPRPLEQIFEDAENGA